MILVEIPVTAIVLAIVKIASPIDSSEDSAPFTFLDYWIGIIIAVTGGILSIISFIYNRRRDRFQGLSEAFRILNHNMNREARRVVHTHKVTQATREIFGFSSKVDDSAVIRVCGDIVQTDMDQIGTMARNNLFYEDIFLQLYSSSIIIEWLRLEENIIDRGIGRSTPDYRKNFELLKNAAVEYRKKRYKEPDPVALISKSYLKRKPLRKIIQQLAETFNDPKIRELSYFDFYDDSLTIHGFPPNLPRNKEGFKQFIYVLWKAFPDVRITFDYIITSGNKVACRYNLTGTHKGEFEGLQPTNKQFRVNGITEFSFRDSKVIERWNIVDMISLMDQLKT